MNETTIDILESTDFLMHYGVGHDRGGHSGRYPWGSGDSPYQTSGDWLSRVEQYHKAGYSETEIAKMVGYSDDDPLSTTEYRAFKEIASDERRSYQVARARQLKAEGYSNTAIAKELGFKNESSVRNLFNAEIEERKNAASNTAEFLKQQLEEKGTFIDVGKGVYRELGLNSEEKFNQALIMLDAEGYPTYQFRVEQATNPGKFTTVRALCPPGTDYKDVYDKNNKVSSITDYSAKLDSNGNDIFTKDVTKFPVSLDSKRLSIKYAEDGGELKDGVIEIRRGVKDLDLGDSHYAQVRIMVDNTHYLKGMAVYSDDIPDGYDVMFNTNKHKDKTKLEVLKECKIDDATGEVDRSNPFGALIKKGGQSTYIDSDGKEKQSLINKTREEGDWNEWADNLPAQFLSKQSQQLIDRQLKLSMENKKNEYNDILSLENGTIKKKLLADFADGCDSDAVSLKAAALPGQKFQVILPLKTIGDNEIYAPNYKDGDTVALIRYPHGGTFEIPILKVNNSIKEGDATISKNAKDAVGISKKVADRLSGADFDGDTVQVIPCNSSRSSTKIISTHQLKDLEGFDPKASYGTHESNGHLVNNITGLKCKAMTNTGKEMGVISNLITDMTLQGANEAELARAVKHSMVVIDAAKHKLDYKQSEKDNDIESLKKRYQVKTDSDTNGKKYGGASTLISRSKSEASELKSVGNAKINQVGKPWYDPKKPEGALIKNYVEETYTDKNGKTQYRTNKTTKMALASDANELLSGKNHEGTPQEKAYANYANYMKSLANQARKEYINTKEKDYSPSAKLTYASEVESLNSKLRLAESNRPKERQAQLIAASIIDAKKTQDPSLKERENRDRLKKVSSQALATARAQVGAKRSPIGLTDREWEAIQAGAISKTKLSNIITYVDADELRQRATPRSSSSISVVKQNRIASMKALGYTNAEIAEAVGVSVSTVQKY